MPEKTSPQGAVEGDVEQTGNNAEGGQQAANRHTKDVGDDGGASGDIDDADEEILQEARNLLTRRQETDPSARKLSAASPHNLRRPPRRHVPGSSRAAVRPERLSGRVLRSASSSSVSSPVAIRMTLV